MARLPRKRRIIPLATDEPETSQESEEEIDAPSLSGASQELEEPAQSQDTTLQEEATMSETETTQEGAILFRGMPEEEIIHTIQDGLAELSPEGLTRCLNYIQDLRRTKEEEIKDDLLRQFREMATKAGVPFDRIFPTPRRGSGSGVVAPKFRHPDDPSLTWAGRGVKPNWLKQLEADGHNAEEYRIRDAATG